MKRNTWSKLITATAIVASVMGITSCNEKKFHINGNIAEAKDSTLYLENMSLNGAVKIDSVKLGDDGSFAFSGKEYGAPEFYRLRIAGQIINVAVDSTETIEVKASYPTMASQYEIKGSDNCTKIKELAMMQMQLQNRIRMIVNAPMLKVDEVTDSVMSVVEEYKTAVKTKYIFNEPMKAYSYFALFQTVNVGGMQSLIFNPRNNEKDTKVFAAVATSWDAFYPESERGANLHNIALEGLKNVRIIKAKQNAAIDPKLINTSGVIDIALPDHKGVTRRLSSLSGKVVILDFHLFAGEGSTKRIMMLRELYNKYHSRGLEIYQVSADTNEHFWKEQTAALPWISVYAGDNIDTVFGMYNVQMVPTFFLLGKDTNVYKRDVQIKNLDADIQSLL